MCNLYAESRFTILARAGGITIWTPRRGSAPLPERPLQAITSNEIELSMGTQICVQEQDGRRWYALFLRLIRHRKPQRRKFVVHPLGTPLEKTVMVKPNKDHRCFIV